MSGSAPVDMELKKAFQELQVKVMTTTQNLKLSDMEIETLKRAVKHAAFTHQEISTLRESVLMYKQIGRLFVLTDKTNILEGLEKKSEKASAKIQELESNKQYLERSMKESEENLRELVASKQKDR